MTERFDVENLVCMAICNRLDGGYLWQRNDRSSPHNSE
jgi:hypothetical protein